MLIMIIIIANFLEMIIIDDYSNNFIESDVTEKLGFRSVAEGRFLFKILSCVSSLSQIKKIMFLVLNPMKNE